MRCANEGENEKNWRLGKAALENFLKIASLLQLRKPQMDFSVLRLHPGF